MSDGRAGEAEQIVRDLAALTRSDVVIDDPNGYRCVICKQLANSAMRRDHPKNCVWYRASMWAWHEEDVLKEHRA